MREFIVKKKGEIQCSSETGTNKSIQSGIKGI